MFQLLGDALWFALIAVYKKITGENINFLGNPSTWDRGHPARKSCCNKHGIMNEHK